jgi:CubicO group peptidase (beta-lactamase class C family)/murein DD-endopeptidase MepM/ murein hydrolase activator NlpD
VRGQLRAVGQSVRSVLEGYAAVLFCVHPLAGAAFLGVTFIRPEVGLAGVLGALAAWATEGRSGKLPAPSLVSVCNGLLAGLAIGATFEFTVHAALLALLAGVFAGLLTRIFGNWLYRLNRLPVLSVGFVLATWFLLAVARDIPQLVPAAPALYPLWPPAWLNSFFTSLGWFLFTPHPVAGIVMFVALLVSSAYLALLAIAGYAAGAVTLFLLGSSVPPGATGFNFVIAAMAVGGVFTFPDRASFAWGLLAAVVAALICMAFPVGVQRAAISTLSAPSFVSAWLVLTALSLRARNARPYLQLENPGLPERSLAAARLARARLVEPGSYPINVPFSGKWLVSQGIDGPHTHRGPWRHAFDFIVVDEGGRSFRREGRRLEDFYCFGVPVLAPVAGQVWRSESSLPDNAPGELEVRGGRNFGNYVLIRTSDGAFVLVGHLRQGSVAVSPGQWVEAGMPIGSCGNSGRSPQPHIHVQVQSGPEIGAPTRRSHLRSIVHGRTPGLDGGFALSFRPAEGDLVSGAVLDGFLATAMHLPAGRRLNFEADGGAGSSLRIDVGLLGQFRIVAEDGSSAAFDATADVLAFYDKTGRGSLLLDTWLLALGLTPFSSAATRWRDAPPAGLAPLTPAQRVLSALLRPFGASFESQYERQWEDSLAGWRQTGRHVLKLVPGLAICLETEAIIDPRLGCRELILVNGTRRYSFRLSGAGDRGDVGIPPSFTVVSPEAPLGDAAKGSVQARSAAAVLLFAGFLAASMPSEARAAACGSPPVELGDGWPVSEAGAAGLDAASLCGVDRLLAQWPQPNIHSIVVARGGRLVMERYFRGADERWGVPVGIVDHGPRTRHDLRSITKSVVSLLVGIAAAEGRFPPLDSSVLDFFPDYRSLRTANNGEITFRHLLAMSAGWDWNEALPYTDPANSEIRMIATSDPVRFVLQQGMRSKPGTMFNYSGGATTVLAAAIERGTRQRLEDFARERLFRPLGIADTEWVRLPNGGGVSAASGLRLRPRDMAKLGQLLVGYGAWQGRQVVPREWIAESIRPRIRADGFYHYGYHWWLGQTSMKGRQLQWTSGSGWGGQRVFAQPDLDLVVAVTAGHYGNPLQQVIPVAIFTRLVLPSVRN